MRPAVKKEHYGFTLIEMAMVLMIVGLLLGGMLVPLSAQMDQRNVTDTRKQLDEIQQALIGYAIINGRLPCPATSASVAPGTEDPAGGGICTFFSNSINASDNYLPAVTLGLSGTDSAGLLEDAWGNPIRYAVTPWKSGSTYVYTTNSGMSLAGISNLSNSNLDVCSTATGATSSACGSGYTLTSNAVAVIYSTGKNGASGGTGSDEKENLNPNASDLHGYVFVSHNPSSVSGNEFDDIVTWISPNILINRMVAAGKLP